MTQNKFEKKIYELVSMIGKAISSPKRLEILALLRQSPRTVDLLSKQTNMSVANTSQHLKVLSNVNLVESEKKGLYVTYRLTGNEIITFYETLFNLAKITNAEIDQITSRHINKEFIFKMANADLLLDKLSNSKLVLVDVRPQEEYFTSHIQGAISIPLQELNDHLRALPKDLEIVIYCRGPYCTLSVDAVEILRKNGFNAFKMDQGIPEWQSEGLPIETLTN